MNVYLSIMDLAFFFPLHFLFTDYDDYFMWDDPNKKPNDPYADDNCKFFFLCFVLTQLVSFYAMYTYF